MCRRQSRLENSGRWPRSTRQLGLCHPSGLASAQAPRTLNLAVSPCGPVPGLVGWGPGELRFPCERSRQNHINCQGDLRATGRDAPGCRTTHARADTRRASADQRPTVARPHVTVIQRMAVASEGSKRKTSRLVSHLMPSGDAAAAFWLHNSGSMGQASTSVEQPALVAVAFAVGAAVGWLGHRAAAEGRPTAGDARVGLPKAARHRGPCKMVLCVRKDLKMKAGKIAAQVRARFALGGPAHAPQLIIGSPARDLSETPTSHTWQWRSPSFS